ncbi:hypothetical protein [Spirosoma linguale]|uniref:Uncharacterized protein n=1 Tax=Spirosoma linguale (strain ATCC 33905 / DSM 74 / LMG 10896 / Claus 1) TaxID=504472 RepID=D2QK97_SPILD|nr:hypothetical protein Slin_2910 [Spirosoma linguale DSM 74]
MVAQREETFRISRRIINWVLFGLFMIVAATVVLPVFIAAVGQPYPDLSFAPLYGAACAFLWIPYLTECWRLTTTITLTDQGFSIRKLAQKPRQFRYSDIIAYNERREVGRGDSFLVLTVYQKNDFFIIKSNAFPDYERIKAHFCQFGESIPYRKVVTLPERNRLRCLLSGLALFIVANIVFGYLAYNRVDHTRARLTAVMDVVDRITENRPKGNFKGVYFRLRRWPELSFYASRRAYSLPLQPLKQVVHVNQPITLLIPESEFRKKIAHTEPLTIGDKYINYSLISVYGIYQPNAVRIQATGPALEPTRTNPLLRTILLVFLLLVCWAGWVYVDQHKVIRTD